MDGGALKRNGWLAGWRNLIFASLPVESRCVIGRVSRGGLGSHTENHRGKTCALRFITATVT